MSREVTIKLPWNFTEGSEMMLDVYFTAKLKVYDGTAGSYWSPPEPMEWDVLEVSAIEDSGGDGVSLPPLVAWRLFDEVDDDAIATAIEEDNLGY